MMALLLSKSMVVLQLFSLLQSSIVLLADQPEPIASQSAVVQGSVYCKDCKYIGHDTLDGATPLEGAVVKLSCKDELNPLVQEARTNRNGNFLFKQPKQLSLDEFKACKAFLVSSLVDSCNTATNLNSGLDGSSLSLIHNITTKKPLKYDLFIIKPFAFEPSAEGPCEDRKPYEVDEVICNPECVLINYGCYC